MESVHKLVERGVVFAPLVPDPANIGGFPVGGEYCPAAVAADQPPVHKVRGYHFGMTNETRLSRQAVDSCVRSGLPVPLHVRFGRIRLRYLTAVVALALVW